MEAIFASFGKTISHERFQYILVGEQKAYLKAMDLPNGIAANAALLENVFVTLVCILNKIPIFVVGKPGMVHGKC
jgi:E3 ubiquitin-protein ligase RNF213